ncbi:hypothetical protein BZA77DRAFT_274323 [Pyronema omphalodes]|nr:hypothetical protein BZA77DRAFT_274323 [Pyronema omphalodes]
MSHETGSPVRTRVDLSMNALTNPPAYSYLHGTYPGLDDFSRASPAQPPPPSAPPLNTRQIGTTIIDSPFNPIHQERDNSQAAREFKQRESREHIERGQREQNHSYDQPRHLPPIMFSPPPQRLESPHPSHQPSPQPAQASTPSASTPSAHTSAQPRSTPAIPANQIPPGGAPARKYLNEQVTPALLEGMKMLASTQPKEPLLALARFLEEWHEKERDVVMKDEA